MGWYVILCNLTDAGVSTIMSDKPSEGEARPPDPIELLEAAVEERDGAVESAFWTLGAHDLVAIVELPTPDDMGAVMMALAGLGAIRTTTLTALPRGDRYTDIKRQAMELHGHLRGGHLRGGHLRGGHLRGGDAGGG